LFDLFVLMFPCFLVLNCFQNLMAMKITACLKFWTKFQSKTHKHCKNNKLAAT
jgi:hypothetical protein